MKIILLMFVISFSRTANAEVYIYGNVNNPKAIPSMAKDDLMTKDIYIGSCKKAYMHTKMNGSTKQAHPSCISKLRHFNQKNTYNLQAGIPSTGPFQPSVVPARRYALYTTDQVYTRKQIDKLLDGHLKIIEDIVNKRSAQ